MNRKSVTRARRKEIMRLGVITFEGWLTRDDDGNRWPRKDWGYSIHANINGFRIITPDCNPFEAYKSCLETARMCMKMNPNKMFTGNRLSMF